MAVRCEVLTGCNIPIAKAVRLEFPARVFTEILDVLFVDKNVIVNRCKDKPRIGLDARSRGFNESLLKPNMTNAARVRCRVDAGPPILF